MLEVSGVILKQREKNKKKKKSMKYSGLERHFLEERYTF